jgi:putative transposase
VFPEDRDYQYYLDTLFEWKERLDVKLYAWCLMTNHVHLILEPPEKISRLSQLMKRLAGRQTRYFNCQQGRSGTLWEGRYRSSPIQTEGYFLACLRYVELNPVRARIVAKPDDYDWSSYAIRIRGAQSCALNEHPCYTALGQNDDDRRQRYKKFIRSAIPDGEWDLIRESVHRGQLTGNRNFVDEVESIIGQRIEHRRPGNQPKIREALAK